MRGAVVHGILLAVMLIYGYRTWTRDKTVKPDLGSVVLWDKTEADIVSVEMKQHDKIVKVEKKGSGPEQYWWGTETDITWKPKATPPAAGSGSAGSGSAAPKVEEEEASRKTKEFPLAEGPNDTAHKLVTSLPTARALRDLGTPTADQKKEFKLDDSKTTLTVTFKDGARTFLIGSAVYGGTDKYALDQTTGHVYILSHELLTGLEIGESSLHLTDARGFDASKIEKVTIEASGGTKVAQRLETTDADGKEVKTWAEPGQTKGNQTLANFIDGLARLAPTEYDAALKPSDMTPVLKVTYKDDHGATLGTLALYKFEKPGELAPGQELDPANPPKGEVQYYIVTDKTRVAAMVRKDLAQRSESDFEMVLSGKEPEEKGSGSGSGKPANPPPPPGMFTNPKTGQTIPLDKAAEGAAKPQPPVAPAPKPPVTPKPPIPVPAGSASH